jgi:putative DNA primase/helicase
MDKPSYLSDEQWEGTHAAEKAKREKRRARPGGGAAAAASTDDDAELARLARLPVIEYERTRTCAAKRLGCRAAMLDRLVVTKRAELGINRDDGKQGRPIEFATPEPWPALVDGAALLDDIAAALGDHVVMGAHERAAVALWVVHAHLLDRSMISPRLAIRSAVKGSGKTTLLDVLARLVPRPLPAASVTPSAIFRVIAAHAPTLLIDEADTLFRDGDEALRGVLNAGHRRGGAVLRSVGDDFEPRAFPCYAATVIALIGQLPGTLADRSIDIVLTRRLPSEQITPFRFDRTERLDKLARRIARWANDNSDQVGRDPAMPFGVYNRAADNWRPLLGIAYAVGGSWPEKARQAAVALAGGGIDEVSRTELLLSDIRERCRRHARGGSPRRGGSELAPQIALQDRANRQRLGRIGVEPIEALLGVST